MAYKLYDEIVSASETFQKNRRIEALKPLIPQSRLYNYGFRSLIGSLEVTKERIIEVFGRSNEQAKWHLRQVINQLDQLDMLSQLEVPNDFRALTVTFSFHHKALHSIRDDLREASEISDGRVTQISRNFEQALRSVVDKNGLYLANWKEPEEWNMQFFPDVGLKVVKLVYANRHSLNLAIIPKGIGPHKHSNTSEVHFSLEQTDGDQITRGYRLNVTEPYAVPIRPDEWHGYEEHRYATPHQLLFLTGSKQILGWGIVIDRSVTESSKLNLTPIPSQEIAKTQGVLLARAIEDLESKVSYKALEKKLIDFSKTKGITLSAVAVPYVWSDNSEDVIDIVVKGRGELIAVNNATKIREGDAFAIPFGIEYQVRNSDGEPMILLSSKLEV